MPRVTGVDLPPNKRIEIALTYLYGVGRTLAAQIVDGCQIDPAKRAKDLTEEETSRLIQTIQGNHRVEGDLRREVAANIRRLLDIGSYRGLRHRLNLPVRGQRTRTNARTRKGPRRTVGVQRKGKTVGRPSTSTGTGTSASKAG